MINLIIFYIKSQERDKFSQTVSKHQKEVQDLQALVYEESQARVRLQMELDAKDSEIESLHRTVANFNSETASLSSGADNDIDELGLWLYILFLK